MNEDPDLVPPEYWNRLNERLTGKCCVKATLEERDRCVQVCHQVQKDYQARRYFDDEAYGALRCVEEILKEALPGTNALALPFNSANGFYEVVKDADGCWAVRQLGYRRLRALFEDTPQGEADAHAFARLLNGPPPE